jgi:hypothetical protein
MKHCRRQRFYFKSFRLSKFAFKYVKFKIQNLQMTLDGKSTKKVVKLQKLSNFVVKQTIYI